MSIKKIDDILPAITLHGRDEHAEIERTLRTVINLNIDCLSETLNPFISYSQGQIKLQDLTPVARDLSDMIVNSAITQALDSDQNIPCQKGCSHCCNYLVAVSPAEAFAIQNDISNLPKPKKRDLLHNSLKSARKILRNQLPSETLADNNELQNISDWYAGLEMTCPFLDNNSCSIYNSRPLACREYNVTTPASLCRIKQASVPQVIKLPVSMAEVLMKVSTKLLASADSALMLPLAMPWCDVNDEFGEMTFPVGMAVDYLVKEIEIAQNAPQTTTAAAI